MNLANPGPDIVRQLSAESSELGRQRGELMGVANNTGGRGELDVNAALKDAAQDGAGYYELHFRPDPAMLEGTMQYAYDFVEKIPLVKREAFQVTADEIGKKNPKAKQAKLEQFYDNSLVQELINEGFFTSLWGK